ncbi:MAG: type II toxin-antitoxin system HicA family toxin [bacterium]|nr:type II toxin-antitoxin system HicA family toxin [bacterium]
MTESATCVKIRLDGCSLTFNPFFVFVVYGILGTKGQKMGRNQKLLQRLLNNPKNVHFDDLIRLVFAFGFIPDRIKGSHHTFKHPLVPDAFLLLQPDKNGQAKPYQIKQHNLRIDSDEE